jgi:acetate kinase
MRSVSGVLTHVPHVAVFDTAFHSTLPAEAATYAVPARRREEWEIRRYGCHGLSVQWAAEQVPAARLVVCHLGGGCSVTAVQDGRSVDDHGLQPTRGVPMTTRSGAIDPGALLYPLREQGLFAEENDRQLENESGLAGSASAALRSTLTRTRPPDANVASFRSTVCVVVRAARENLVFARAMRRLVA